MIMDLSFYLSSDISVQVVIQVVVLLLLLLLSFRFVHVFKNTHNGTDERQNGLNPLNVCIVYCVYCAMLCAMLWCVYCNVEKASAFALSLRVNRRACSQIFPNLLNQKLPFFYSIHRHSCPAFRFSIQRENEMSNKLFFSLCSPYLKQKKNFFWLLVFMKILWNFETKTVLM